MGSQTTINKSIQKVEQSATDIVTREITYQLSDAINLNALHTQVYSKGLVDFMEKSQRERYFTTALSNHTSAVMTYIGFPDKQFYGARRDIQNNIYVVQNNESTGGNSEYYHTNELGEATSLLEELKNFDLTTRPWYKSAINLKTMNFSPIYSHFALKLPTITASIPVYSSKGELEAVFGVDLLLTWLGQLLSELSIGQNGHVIITNAENQIIALTTGEDEFKLVDGKSTNALITESENPLTQAIANLNVEFKPNQSVTIEVNKKNYFVSMVEYTEFGLSWRIFTVLAEVDYYTQINNSILLTLLFLIGAIVVVIGFFLYITRLIVQPIQKLNVATQKLVEGDFEPIIETTSKNEVETLTRNFNTMGQKITVLVHNLEEQVAIRTQELELKNTQLNDLSYKDSLTNIANRRKFFEVAHTIVKHSSRTNHPIALMMLDIDWFKDYNDNYGHVAGDKCLKEIASVISSCVKREIDLCARYGGEEFVVILQELHEADAKQLANRIREKVEALNIEHASTPFGKVTISIGVFFGPIASKMKVETIIDMADMALYEAKNLGRNQIFAYKHTISNEIETNE